MTNGQCHGSFLVSEHRTINNKRDLDGDLCFLGRDIRTRRVDRTQDRTCPSLFCIDWAFVEQGPWIQLSI